MTHIILGPGLKMLVQVGLTVVNFNAYGHWTPRFVRIFSLEWNLLSWYTTEISSSTVTSLYTAPSCFSLWRRGWHTLFFYALLMICFSVFSLLWVCWCWLSYRKVTQCLAESPLIMRLAHWKNTTSTKLVLLFFNFYCMHGRWSFLICIFLVG